MSRRLLTDLIEEVPRPVPDPATYEDAAANLRHTLAVFNHPESGLPPSDADLVVTATSNVYGPTKTGLTWKDLRLIAEALHRLEGLDK